MMEGIDVVLLVKGRLRMGMGDYADATPTSLLRGFET